MEQPSDVVLFEVLSRMRDNKEKQEGSVLAQCYVIGLLRKAPVYGCFGASD